MIDNPEKTRQLVAVLKAALPFEVDLTPQAVAAIAKQQDKVAVERRMTVSDVSYAGDEGGIMCHLRPDDGDNAIFISLTHVRVRRTLPFASAVINYQKRRVKKLKRQPGGL